MAEQVRALGSGTIKCHRYLGTMAGTNSPLQLLVNTAITVSQGGHFCYGWGNIMVVVRLEGKKPTTTKIKMNWQE